MSKVDKKSLVVGVILCLLPILVGLYYYNMLPSEIAIHFDSNSNPNDFVGKELGVFGLPSLMAVIFIFTSFALDSKEMAKKGVMIVKFVLPVLSIIFQGLIIYYALGNSVDVMRLSLFIVALIQVVLGNYMPKTEYWGEYNFNLFGLEKGVNEKKVVRAYSKYMVTFGLVIFVVAIFSAYIALMILLASAVVMSVLPFYLAKKYKEK